MKQLATVLFYGLLLAQPVAAQTENKSPFSFETSYMGDVVGNFSGGIKTGSAYLGKANVKMGFNTKKAGWWNGGEFFVNGMNTHGDEPTAKLIGDFQVASNLEAGNHTALYELWYKQQIGNVAITVGLQDLNANYAVSEGGNLFNNSYFGIHSVCSDNIPVSIFPLTALGVDIHWAITEDYHWQAVIFDGVPDDFERNPYNTNWSLSKKEGYLAVTEFHATKSLVNGQKGAYKLGAYYLDSELAKTNYGFHLVADQDITNQFSLFTQIGISPKNRNNHYQCYGLGLNYRNFSTNRPHDKFGLAVNHAQFTENANGNETVFEVIYHLQLNENVYLRPDIQYIIHPAGTEEKLNNALVGMLRFGIEF